MNLETVSNVYPNGLPAASELDLDVAEGKLMVLVRPSGSGKTTALRMVTDLGGHHLRDALDRRRVVNNLLPKDRKVASASGQATRGNTDFTRISLYRQDCLLHAAMTEICPI